MKASLERKLSNFTQDASIINFDSHLCLKDRTLKVGGAFNSDFFSNVFFEMKRCINSTSIQCKSNEEIDARIGSSNMRLYYILPVLNPELYNNPISFSLESFFYKVDPRVFIQEELFFSKFKVLSDIGLFSEEFREDSTYNLYNSKEIYQLTQPDGIMTRLFITLGRENLIVKRFYPKLQEITGSIGGFIQVMSIIALIITKFFNKFYIEQDIVQQVFFEPYDNTGDPNVQRFFSQKINKIIPDSVVHNKEEENNINNVKIHSNVSSSQMIKSKENKVLANQLESNKFNYGKKLEKINIFSSKSLNLPDPPKLLDKNINVNEYLYYKFGFKE